MSNERTAKLLRPFVYQGPRASPRIGPFNLQSKQRCDPRRRVLWQQPWFNGQGEFLGFGDLSIDNIKTIARNISREEFFIGCWKFRSFKDLREAIFCPSIEFVGRHCQFIVTCNMVLFVEGSRLEKLAIHFTSDIKWCKVKQIDAYHWLLIDEVKQHNEEIEIVTSSDSGETLSSNLLRQVPNEPLVRFVLEDISSRVEVHLKTG